VGPRLSCVNAAIMKCVFVQFVMSLLIVCSSVDRLPFFKYITVILASVFSIFRETNMNIYYVLFFKNIVVANLEQNSS